MPPSDAPAEPAWSGIPSIIGFCGAGIASIGFGVGYGASAYRRSVAFKDLIEKFPEPPTAEAEALARSGATRAFIGGTALAALMGVGAVTVARSNGIKSTQDLADEIKKWLPTREALNAAVAPRLEPLQRTITEHMQPMANRARDKFDKSELAKQGRERADESVKAKSAPLEPWEKELIAKLEDKAK
uniref:Uncharacterized protein n=1 Tax=Haptolina brevifila TaxID=156173 RepID=A0A7S2MER4_9EUKA|mmetsp:Transcript_50789/g.101077  ORF Transcript_50789/g.101077 Transcript_50789/m.101077 type:complete len:187 (+) Transcript_50789:54-614(+)